MGGKRNTSDRLQDLHFDVELLHHDQERGFRRPELFGEGAEDRERRFFVPDTGGGKIGLERDSRAHREWQGHGGDEIAEEVEVGHGG